MNIFAGFIATLVADFALSSAVSAHLRPGELPLLTKNQIIRITHNAASIIPHRMMGIAPTSIDVVPSPQGTEPYNPWPSETQTTSFAQLYPGLALETGYQPVGVVAADLNADDITDLIVTNSISGNVSVLLGNGNGSFQNQQIYSVKPFARSPVIADFNGDGKLDVATANYIENSISILLGNGDGTFQDSITYNLGTVAQSIVTADFNHDGVPDILVSNGNYILVLLGNGDGSFKDPESYALAANEIIIADLNRDGNPDVVAMDSADTLIGVCLGNSDGTFQEEHTYSTGFYPTGIAVSDFNANGNVDIAMTGAITDVNGQMTDYMGTFIGNGDGTFQAPSSTTISPPPAAAGMPSGLISGDLNGDGTSDLIVTFGGLVDVSVLEVFLGDDNGKFMPRENYSAGNSLGAITIADLNGDGKLDVAITNMQGNSIIPLFGNGDGTLQAQKVFGVYGDPTALALGDLNHDGRQDIVTASQVASTVSVLLGGEDDTFLPAQNYFIGGIHGGWLWDVTIADFNGDGNPDVAVTIESENAVGILFGNGDGTLQRPQTYPVGGQPLGIATADLDGNGTPDLVVTNSASSDVSVLLNNGNGSFQSETFYATGAYPGDVAILDFNGDSRPDIAVANYDDNSVSVLMGNGNGSFQTQEVYPVGLNPWSIVVADFNKDGHPDIAVTNSCTDTNSTCGYSIGVLLGNGDGTFQGQQTYATSAPPIGITVADINDDGNPDIVETNTSYGTSTGYPFDTIGVFPGNGDGTFQSQQIYAAGFFPYDVASADLNGNGWPDLVTANLFDYDVSVMPHLNPAPVLSTTHFDAVSGQTLSGQLLANDPFGLTLEFTLVSLPEHGIVNVTNSGSFNYTSSVDFSGNDSFVVSVSNGHASSQSKVHIAVSNKPAAPTISTPSAMTIQEATDGHKTQGGPESFTVAGSGTLTVNGSSNNSSLIATSNIVVSPVTSSSGTRQVTVYPTVGETGKATVTLAVKDTYGQSANSSFEVTVSAASPNPSGGGGGGGGFTTLELYLFAILALLMTMRRWQRVRIRIA